MEFASRRARLPRASVAAVASLVVLAGIGCRARGDDAASKAAQSRHRAPPAAAFAIGGAVYDAGGQGGPDVRVLLFPSSGGDTRAADARRALTDVAGKFEVTGLAEGRYTILVDALGLGAIEPQTVEVPGPRVTIRFAARVRWLDGRVVAYGRPAADARVLLGGEGAARAA